MDEGLTEQVQRVERDWKDIVTGYMNSQRELILVLENILGRLAELEKPVRVVEN